jgi:hypothetical protein
MSNLLDNGYTQLNNLTQINCDDIQTESINTKALYINNILFDPSGVDLSNYVTTTQLSTQLTPINNNVATNTTDISGLKLKTTNISYNPTGTLTSFTGNLSFPTNSIASTSINNTTLCDLASLQTISNTKTFSASPIMTGLILNGSLYVNNSNVVISNTRLTYLSSLSSNVQTQLDTLATKLTNQTYTAGTTTTTISNNLSLTNVSFTGNINSTFTKAQFDNGINFSKDLTSSAQQQLNSINTSLSNYVLTTALNTTLLNYITSSFLTTTLSGYVTTSYLSSQLSNYVTNQYLISQNYITTSSLILTLSDYIKKSELNIKLSDYALNSALTTTNSNVTALQNKLVDVYYDVPTAYFDINNNAHIYGVLKLGAILNVEASIDALGVSVGIAGGAAAKATTDILTINNITLPAMNLVSANLSLRIDDLETKTTNQSYILALNTTYITGTLSLTTVRLNSLDSGILQTANQSVVFIGETEIRNDFSVTNGFGMSCDGGIIQNNNSQNTFRGGLRVNNTLQCDDFTSGGTNANINSTNTNINSTTCNITGNTIIKNMSEISIGTIAPYLSILSTKLNTNNRKLQGLVIGKEQLVANEECNCNVGFNYAFGGFENYGYLGLNVNTTDTREALRWFETGVSLPTGDLTVSTGGIIISSGDIKVNTINNRSTNLNINSSYTLNMNSDTINIGTSQSVVPPAFNSINIGSVASLSVINLNGLVYSPYQMNITGAISQW